METYRTEEEQVEALKRWWQENGRSMVIGVVLALGLGFGWQAWQKSRDLAAENASSLYQQMLTALSMEDAQGAAPASALAERLKEEHGGSTYAQFAALHLARLAVNEGRLDDAEEELRGVLAKSSPGEDLHRIAQLRLARVMAAGGSVDPALDLLVTDDGAYAAAYAMARGDILISADRNAEALEAFEAAAAALDPELPMPPTLRDKLEFLRAMQGSDAPEAG